MPLYVQRAIRLLLMALLVLFCFVSVKPQQQNLAAITPTSTMTLSGQAVSKSEPLLERTEQQPEQQELQPVTEQQTAQQQEHTQSSEQQADNTDAGQSMPQQNVVASSAATEATKPRNDTIASTSPAATATHDGSLQKNDAKTPNDSATILVTDEAQDAAAYFETNLYDGQTVTTAHYTLAITHVNKSVTAQATSVTVNGVTLATNTLDITFEDGQNTVDIAVTYVDDNGKELRVQASYTITLDVTNTVIQTTLEQLTTSEQSIRFSAFAERAGQSVHVTVTQNEDELQPKSGRTYVAALSAGTNTFTLRADDVEETYVITRTEQAETITITTDLQDQKVSVANFTFHAAATQHADDIPLTVSINGEQVDGAKTYDVTLQAGTNTITLEATDGADVVSKQYNILYADPTVTTEKPVDAAAPKLKTDLVDGNHVKGLIKTINVWPTAANGTRIRGKNVAVNVNGVSVPFVWDDAEKTSYKLTLQHGHNTVDIRAWDDEGRVVKQQFTIEAEDVDGGVIGQVTMSVEGSVLGIPYFIPPTRVNVHQGEKGSYVLDQLLRQYGYTYRATGTLDTNFYLSAIEKENMLQAVNIPDDLWALVEAASTRASKDDYSPHALGEFNFANGAGWMFSVNGDYPNYGFSDAYFLDGDVVRVRYTLHYGRDINGFGANGVGENATESGSNWEKEW